MQRYFRMAKQAKRKIVIIIIRCWLRETIACALLKLNGHCVEFARILNVVRFASWGSSMAKQ